MHADLLLEFCSLLGISVEETKKRESPERFSITISVQVHRLKSLSAKSFIDLVSTLGDAIELTIGIDEVHHLIEVRPGIPSPDFVDKLNEIFQLPDTMDLRVRIQIQKRIILQSYGLDLNQYHGLYYLFFENLVGLLQAPLPDLDQQLFSSANTPTLVLVSDVNFLCCGMLFTVVGGDNIQRLDNFLPKPSKRVIQRLEYFHNIASENLNWVDFRLERLTPIHFFCNIVGEAENLANILATRLLELLIIYSANRSIIEKHQIKAFYASSEQTTELVTSETPLALDQRDEIIRLITWIETSQKADKLVIFQNTVAREVTGEDTNQNFYDYIDRLPHLLREARWNYRVYLDGKITKHFEKIEEANEKVASVSGKVSDAIDTLTKGFVDTLLASVGVVILTLIASLAENKTQGVIFTVGMWIYAGYLLIFQVVYRLGHLYYSTHLAIKEGEQQLAPYRTALGSNKVNELTAFLAKRKRYFYVMFIITVVLFLAVITAIALSGALLPNALSSLITPSPTPTLTP